MRHARSYILEILLAIAAVVMAFLLSSCCHTAPLPERLGRDTLTVYVERTDTLFLVQTDTVWQAGNAIVTVKIDTVLKKVYVRIKDTVRVTMDTTSIYKRWQSKEDSLRNSNAILQKQIDDGEPWYKKIPAVLIGLGIGFILLLILKIKENL